MQFSSSSPYQFRIQHPVASVWLAGRRVSVPDSSSANGHCQSPEKAATEPAEPEAAERIQQQLQALSESLRQQSQALYDQRQNDLCELRSLAVQIGIAAAEHLLQEKIADGEQNIKAVIEFGLGQFETSDDITVRLHPDDFELCHEASPSDNVQFVADATVPRGNCHMDAGVNTLIMDWRERLNSLQQRLLTGLDDARLEH